MRSLFAALAFLAGAAACTAEVRFKRVWPDWHGPTFFQSFYEYRTGKELTGKWTILRTRPENRAGLYFVVRVENTGAPVAGSVFVVRLIAPDSIATHTYSFPSDVPGGSRVFELGVTGKDWAGRVHPVAWDVELHSATGEILAKKTSFLWEKPG